MYPMNEKEFLTKVTTYELNREGGSLRIDIHEVVAGDVKINFFAVPNLIVRQGEREFIGIGATAEEALADCLTRIKDVSVAAIVPSAQAQV